MKRILLGLTALGVIAGGGSTAVFIAHRAWNSTLQEAAADSAEPVARDSSVQPIRLANQDADQQPASDNPFAARRQNDEAVSRQEAPSDDSRGAPRRLARSHGARALDAATDADSDQRAPTDDAARENREVPLRQIRSVDPFGARSRSRAEASRYAEQPVAAEIANDDGDAIVDTRPVEHQEEDQGVPLDAPTARPASRYDRGFDRPGDDENNSAEPLRPVIDDAATAPTDESDSTEGGGRPGDPRLSGSQAPTLTIEKSAPAEIQIGKAAKFVIKVRNAGSAAAHGVEIHDAIPQGTQLIDATPQAKRGSQGVLTWELGTLKPGDEQIVELQLMPTAEGEIGSVATVHFRAEASVRTVATRPMLNLEVVTLDKVMKGGELPLKIKLSNPGSGAATGVVLNENVPEGLSHPAGRELQLQVGTLKPGEIRELDLTLTATAAGAAMNVITAQAEGNLQAEAQVPVEVVAPQLQVSLAGPKRRYLERNATHNITIANPGTATAKDIELVAVLPKELKFVEANNGGQFDAATHSVYWGLEELPPQESGTVTLTTLPLQPGEAKLQIKGKAQQGLTDQREEILSIEGLAAINFQLSDVNDPIEEGGQTTYEVRVTNQGTKAASNVRLVALLPREMKPLAAEGPGRYKIEGQRVVFEPLKQLAPKADASFSIKAQAAEAGDLRVQVQVTTDEIREPITKEESTRVFGNE